MLFPGQSWKKIVIFSDSLSSLQAIAGFNIDNDIVQKFIEAYSVLTKQGKIIALCCIPSHVGIPGNERADSAAKDGLSLTITALKSPASELLPRATKLISEKWQKSWNNCTGNKLQSTYLVSYHWCLSARHIFISSWCCNHPATLHRPHPVDS